MIEMEAVQEGVSGAKVRSVLGFGGEIKALMSLNDAQIFVVFYNIENHRFV